MSPSETSLFPIDKNEILKRIHQINPAEYASSRNFIRGAVTRLSPYISRGVISTKQIMLFLANQPYSYNECESLLKELAWRDYFQRVWQHKNIDADIQQNQPEVHAHGISETILNADTGIQAIDEGIKELYQTGYLHNHLRMYVAAYACNHLGSHWLVPAKWMYYHLIDGDWASNACSWQWVAGANSKKKYFANQENINKYSAYAQGKTILDVSYEILPEVKHYKDPITYVSFEEQTAFPQNKTPDISNTKHTAVYTPYNLDDTWRIEEDVNRVFLLETETLKRYPVSKKVLQFMCSLAKNIPGIEIYSGSFEDLKKQCSGHLIYKEHPLCRHFTGTCDARDWMCEEVTEYYPSFFGYWKKIEPHIKKHFH